MNNDNEVEMVIRHNGKTYALAFKIEPGMTIGQLDRGIRHLSEQCLNRLLDLLSL